MGPNVRTISLAALALAALVFLLWPRDAAGPEAVDGAPPREGVTIAPPAPAAGMTRATGPGLPIAEGSADAHPDGGAARSGAVTVRVRVDAEDGASFPVQVFVDADGGPFSAKTGVEFPVGISRGTHLWTAYAIGTERYEWASGTTTAEADADLHLILKLGRTNLSVRAVDESRRPLAGVRVLVAPRELKLDGRTSVGLERWEADSIERANPGWLAEWTRTTGGDGIASWGRVRDGSHIVVLSVPNGPLGPASAAQWARLGDFTYGRGDNPSDRTVEIQVLRGRASFRLAMAEVESGSIRVDRRADDGTWIGGWPPGGNVSLVGSTFVGSGFPQGTYRITYAASGSQVYEALLDLADGDDRLVEAPRSLALATVKGTIEGPARGVVKTLFFRSREAMAEGDDRFLDFNLNLRVDDQGRFVAPILPNVKAVSFHDADAAKHADIAIGPRMFAWPPAGPIRLGSAQAGTLKIRVLSRDGVVVPGSALRVDRASPGLAGGAVDMIASPRTCDEKGEAVAGPDLPGVWTVFAWADGTPTDSANPVRREVRVEPGRTTEIEIRLP